MNQYSKKAEILRLQGKKKKVTQFTPQNTQKIQERGAPSTSGNMDEAEKLEDL